MTQWSDEMDKRAAKLRKELEADKEKYKGIGQLTGLYNDAAMANSHIQSQTKKQAEELQKGIEEYKHIVDAAKETAEKLKGAEKGEAAMNLENAKRYAEIDYGIKALEKVIESREYDKGSPEHEQLGITIAQAKTALRNSQFDSADTFVKDGIKEVGGWCNSAEALSAARMTGSLEQSVIDGNYENVPEANDIYKLYERAEEQFDEGKWAESLATVDEANKIIELYEKSKPKAEPAKGGDDEGAFVSGAKIGALFEAINRSGYDGKDTTEGKKLTEGKKEVQSLVGEKKYQEALAKADGLYAYLKELEGYPVLKSIEDEKTSEEEPVHIDEIDTAEDIKKSVYERLTVLESIVRSMDPQDPNYFKIGAVYATAKSRADNGSYLEADSELLIFYKDLEASKEAEAKKTEELKGTAVSKLTVLKGIVESLSDEGLPDETAKGKFAKMYENVYAAFEGGNYQKAIDSADSVSEDITKFAEARAELEVRQEAKDKEKREKKTKVSEAVVRARDALVDVSEKHRAPYLEIQSFVEKMEEEYKNENYDAALIYVPQIDGNITLLKKTVAEEKAEKKGRIEAALKKANSILEKVGPLEKDALYKNVQSSLSDMARELGSDNYDGALGYMSQLESGVTTLEGKIKANEELKLKAEKEEQERKEKAAEKKARERTLTVFETKDIAYAQLCMDVLDKEDIETFSKTSQSGEDRGTIYVAAVFDKDDTEAQERAKELKEAWSQKTSKKWTKRAELTVEQYDRLIASKSAEGKFLKELKDAGKIIMENPFGDNHKIKEEIPVGAYNAMLEMAGYAPPVAATQPEGEMTSSRWMKRAEITKEEGEELEGSNGPGGKLWNKLVAEKKIVMENPFGDNHKINARIPVKDYDMMKAEAYALMHPKPGEPVPSPTYTPLDEPEADFPDEEIPPEKKEEMKASAEKAMEAARAYVKQNPEDEEARVKFASAETLFTVKEKYGTAEDIAKTILANAGKNGKKDDIKALTQEEMDAASYKALTQEEALLGLGGVSGAAVGPTKTAKEPPKYPVPPPVPPAEELKEMTPDQPVAPPKVPPAEELSELVEDLKDYEEKKPDNDGFEDVEEVEDDENEII